MITSVGGWRCVVFVSYVDMREKKQTVKYKQTLQHHNTGHNTVTQPTKGTNPIILNRSIFVNRRSYLDDFRFSFGHFSLLFSQFCFWASDDRLGWHRRQDRGKIPFPAILDFIWSLCAGHEPLGG